MNPYFWRGFRQGLVAAWLVIVTPFALLALVCQFPSRLRHAPSDWLDFCRQTLRGAR